MHWHRRRPPVVISSLDAVLEPLTHDGLFLWSAVLRQLLRWKCRSNNVHITMEAVPHTRDSGGCNPARNAIVGYTVPIGVVVFVDVLLRIRHALDDRDIDGPRAALRSLRRSRTRFCVHGLDMGYSFHALASQAITPN